MRKNFIKYLTILAFAALQPLFSSAENAHGPAMAASAAAPLVPQAAEIPKPKDRAKVYLALLKSSELNSENWFKWVDAFKSAHASEQVIGHLRDYFVQQQFSPQTFQTLFLQLGLKFTQDWAVVTQNDVKMVASMFNYGKTIECPSAMGSSKIEAKAELEEKADKQKKEAAKTKAMVKTKFNVQAINERFIKLAQIKEIDSPFAFMNNQHLVFNIKNIEVPGNNHLIQGLNSITPSKIQSVNNHFTVNYHFQPVFINMLYQYTLRETSPGTVDELFTFLDNVGDKPPIKDPALKKWFKIQEFAPIYKAEIALFLKHDPVNARRMYDEISESKSFYATFAKFRLAEIDLGVYAVCGLPLISGKEHKASPQQVKSAIKLLEQAIKDPGDQGYVPFFQYRLATVYMGTFDKKNLNRKEKLSLNTKEAEKLLKQIEKHSALDHLALCKQAEILLHINTDNRPEQASILAAKKLVDRALICSGGEDLSSYLEVSFLLGKYGDEFKDVKKAIAISQRLKDWFGLYKIYNGEYGEEFKNPHLADKYLRSGVVVCTDAQTEFAKKLYYSGEINESLYFLEGVAPHNDYAAALLARYLYHPNSPGYDKMKALKYYELLMSKGLINFVVIPLAKIYAEIGNHQGMEALAKQFKQYYAERNLNVDVSFLAEMEKRGAAAAGDSVDVSAQKHQEPQEVEVVEDQEEKADGPDEEEQLPYIYKPYQKPQGPAQIVSQAPPLFWSEEVENLYDKFMSHGVMRIGEAMALAKGLGCTIVPSGDPNKVWVKDLNGPQKFLFHNHFADNVINFNRSYWKKMKQMLKLIYEHGQV